MTTRDLFEMASMDVLGLLDEQERASFERAFRAAPPEVQAQVRAEQVQCARADRMLPDVRPPVGLRARVLAAVREAINAVRTEPVARIGPGVGRVGFNSAPLWRAACLGFATASLVMGVVTYKILQDNRAIADTALSNLIADDLVKKAGPGFMDVLLKPRMRDVTFNHPAGDFDQRPLERRPRARLWVDLDSRTAYLVCDNLPIATGSYSLVIAPDAEGSNPQEVKSFQANSGKVYVPLDNVAAEALDRLQITAPKGMGGGADVFLVATSGT